MTSRLLTAVFAALVAFGAGGAWAQPQVRVAYGDASGDDALVKARDALVNADALEELQRFLSPLRLPADLTIRADRCGSLRRAYDPRSKTVSVCYEAIARIMDVAASQSDASEADRKTAILGAIVETLFHETSYALFDLYDVPVWGRIDDAADRLTAFIMIQFGEDVARTTILGAARFFAWSSRTWTGSDYASAEAPEAQRFYNFLCIAYGGDSITFDNLASNDVLPKYRAKQCAAEYQQVRKAFDLRIMPFIDPDLLVKARSQTW